MVEAVSDKLPTKERVLYLAGLLEDYAVLQEQGTPEQACEPEQFVKDMRDVAGVIRLLAAKVFDASEPS